MNAGDCGETDIVYCLHVSQLFRYYILDTDTIQMENIFERREIFSVLWAAGDPRSPHSSVERYSWCRPAAEGGGEPGRRKFHYRHYAWNWEVMTLIISRGPVQPAHLKLGLNWFWFTIDKVLGGCSLECTVQCAVTRPGTLRSSWTWHWDHPGCQ